MDTILKGDHISTIPAKFGVMWTRISGGEYLNMLFIKIYPICTFGISNFPEKSRTIAKLLAVVHLQITFDIMITYIKQQ